MKEIQELCAQVRQTAYDIHVYHGHGHLEKVYENDLAHRLRKAGLNVKQQHPIQVFDEDGALIGDYKADLLVDGWLIVELKTATALAEEHVAQVLGYLKSARLEHALLINFGSFKFEMRKYAWSQDAVGRKRRSSFLLAALSALLSPKIIASCEDFLTQRPRRIAKRNAERISLRPLRNPLRPLR